MKNIICPKCGNSFTMEDADYASIANQVRNNEFHDEVERRLNELNAQKETEKQNALERESQNHQKQLLQKDKSISEKETEILRLQSQLKSYDEKKKLEMESAISKKNQEIAALNSALDLNEANLKNAVLVEQQKAKDTIQAKEKEIFQLKAQAAIDKSEASVRENGIKEQYETKLKFAQEQVDYYKDLKTKMSTKMVGETLETHCSTVFNTTLRSFLPEAYFEKDNDSSTGSKGDFIFRDYSEGTEYVSIMFEMKNEMDTTATKHKNEDFLRELDKDRREKGCEYAVLVSLLEPDSELYNNGIVDVSHKYEKMYVIRPQFFAPLITLLVQTSKKSIEYQKMLAVEKSKSIDITDFEDKLRDFQVGFSKNCETAGKYFESVIADIDKAIANLNKMKNDLTTTGNQLRLANNKAADLSIKKLTRGNPTMKAKFDEVREAKAALEGNESSEI